MGAKAAADLESIAAVVVAIRFVPVTADGEHHPDEPSATATSEPAAA